MFGRSIAAAAPAGISVYPSRTGDIIRHDCFVYCLLVVAFDVYVYIYYSSSSTNGSSIGVLLKGMSWSWLGGSY